MDRALFWKAFAAVCLALVGGSVAVWAGLATNVQVEFGGTFRFHDVWYNELCDADDRAFRVHNFRDLRKATGRDYAAGPAFSIVSVGVICFSVFKLLFFFLTAPEHPIPNESEWMAHNGRNPQVQPPSGSGPPRTEHMEHESLLEAHLAESARQEGLAPAVADIKLQDLLVAREAFLRHASAVDSDEIERSTWPIPLDHTWPECDFSTCKAACGTLAEYFRLPVVVLSTRRSRLELLVWQTKKAWKKQRRARALVFDAYAAWLAKQGSENALQGHALFLQDAQRRPVPGIEPLRPTVHLNDLDTAVTAGVPTFLVSRGSRRFYYEAFLGSAHCLESFCAVGWASADFAKTDKRSTSWIGLLEESYSLIAGTGSSCCDPNRVIRCETVSVGDVIGCAIDMGTGTMRFSHNGTWLDGTIELGDKVQEVYPAFTAKGQLSMHLREADWQFQPPDQGFAALLPPDAPEARPADDVDMEQFRQALCRSFAYAKASSDALQRIGPLNWQVPGYTVQVACSCLLASIVQMLCEIVARTWFICEHGTTFKQMLLRCEDHIRAAKILSNSSSNSLSNEERALAKLSAIYILAKAPFSLPLIQLCIRLGYTCAKLLSLYRGHPPWYMQVLISICVLSWLVLDAKITYLTLSKWVFLYGLALGKLSMCLARRGLDRRIIGVFGIVSPLSVALLVSWGYEQWHMRHFAHVSDTTMETEIEDTYVCTFMQTQIWNFHGIDGPVSFIHTLSNTWFGFLLIFFGFLLLVWCLLALLSIVRSGVMFSPQQLLLTWFCNPQYYNAGIRINLGYVGGNKWCTFWEPVGAHWFKYVTGAMNDSQAKDFEAFMGLK